MGWFDDLFSGGQRNAYKDLQSHIQQGLNTRQNYWNQANQTMAPYLQAGNQGVNQFQNYLTEFGKNLQSGDWMKGYQESPFAKFQTQEALHAGNQAAAASGMLGSSGHQENSMKLAQNIASGDMQNYFNQLLAQQGLYQQGLSNLTNMGYGAANQLGNWAMNTGNGIANDYSASGVARANQDMARANGMNAFLGGVGGLIGSFF
ncbi:MAG: hypothetical protein A3F10_05650 [Coxiella sp. RIFCSPHIGHO2_12_FULL_42_15]|nr:MAG: hypothetical protein A3F10_05650 [Coxiella sp. RIFCSPHIGHO2_12_FULL_42_15]